MDDVAFVAVVDRSEDLLEDVGCLLLVKLLFLENFVEELASGAEFGDDVEKAFVLVKLENFDDVWMILVIIISTI